MSNKMLIDAIHPEETRVVVLRDKRVEDFDFEAASRRPLRGNIYLAKVTRVEPSLQAAFVEYGGNKHGFLAFSEIHPDYYQIPQADRQALLEEMQAEVAEQEKEKPKRTRGGRRKKAQDAGSDEAIAEASTEEAQTPEAAAGAEDVPREPDEEADAEPPVAAAAQDPADAASVDTAAEAAAETADEPAREGAEVAVEGDDVAAEPSPQSAAAEASSAEEDGAEVKKPAPKRRRRTTKKSDDGLEAPAVSSEDEDRTGDPDPAQDGGDQGDDDSADDVTSMGNSDALEEVSERRRRTPRRNYKIQEVIKRKQILLVQVVKEERGTKGAALTTYLSLAGRYSVLMPNTDRGGGVSRKITDNADRKRLKSLVAELEVPEGMGIILRTAGAARTKTEIKRDFEYLIRLWESVRDLTLKSIAPQLVYEEGNLVKRSIRDLYSKEIDEVLVSGDSAYREAKDFMKMLMPSHAKNVKPYRETTPIFTSYAVEQQLDSMFCPTVTLPSRGSIVINPTEALVAIDVNSGKSNRESNIEDTAVKTNLEAAEEVARQLRLRDLAGLVVIDFIDMDDKRHNRQVEKRLKEALKMDRSRIQVGRISPFGLMEMSRQRTRQGMVETSMVTCPTCSGTGHVRSTPSVALFCLRSLEEHLLKNSDNHVIIRTSSAVALYILNQKRAHLNDLEERFGLSIGVHADEQLGGQHLQILTGERVERAPGDAPPTAQIAPDAVGMDDEDEDAVDLDTAQDEDDASGERSGRRRRRRRRRGPSGERAEERSARDVENAGEDEDQTEEDGETADASGRRNSGDEDTDDGRRSRRRRGRRGGRRHRREEGEDEGAVAEAAGTDRDSARAEGDGASPVADGVSVEAAASQESGQSAEAAESTVQTIEIVTPEDASVPEPADDETSGQVQSDSQESAASAQTEAQPEEAQAEEEATASAASEPASDESANPADEPVPEPAEKDKASARPRRMGWWQRRSFF